MSEFDRDLRESRTQFERIVWPKIKDWFGDNPELHRTEDKPSPLRQEFDSVAGVDYWVVESGAGMLSIASRVQTYDKTTFTVRYSRGTGNDTEYQKRMRQLGGQYELPTYTVQAYVDDRLRELRNAAAIKTAPLYEYISTGDPGDDWPLIQSNESEHFFPIGWSELHDKMSLLVYDRRRAGLVSRAEQQRKITDYADRGRDHE